MSLDALSTVKVNELLESRKELGHAVVVVAGAAHAMVHDRPTRHQIQLVEGLGLSDLAEYTNEIRIWGATNHYLNCASTPGNYNQIVVTIVRDVEAPIFKKRPP